MERRQFITRAGAATITFGLAGCSGLLGSSSTPTPTEQPLPTEEPVAPTVSFDFDVEGETLILTHSAGSKVDPEELSVRVQGAGLSKNVPFAEGAGGSISGEEVTAGDYVEVDVSGNSGGEAEVRIVWASGDTSSTLDAATVSL